MLSGLASGTDLDDNIVLTFNYDLLIEQSLALLGIPFWYGFDWDNVSYLPSAKCVKTKLPLERAAGDLRVPESRALRVLKLHDPLSNWFVEEGGDDKLLRVAGTYDDVTGHGNTLTSFRPLGKNPLHRRCRECSVWRLKRLNKRRASLLSAFHSE